jgi:hypothetical protein
MRWLGWLLLLVGFGCTLLALGGAGILSGIFHNTEKNSDGTQCRATFQVGPGYGPVENRSYGGEKREVSELPAWRRTVNGWERPTWLHRPVEFRRPALHPAAVGLLLTVLVLMAGRRMKDEG